MRAHNLFVLFFGRNSSHKTCVKINEISSHVEQATETKSVVGQSYICNYGSTPLPQKRLYHHRQTKILFTSL